MDIALQHISDPMLKKMRRNITKEETYALIRRMREEVPGIHLRTTLMVGHPGETEQEGISAEVNGSKIGKVFKVMIDREEEDFYVGRTEFDSPEVDPEILVSKEKLLIPGMFYNVWIDDAQAFDLYGSVL